MQAIHKNKDEESGSWRTDSVGVIIYIGRIGRCLKEKYTRRLGKKVVRVWNSRRIFSRYKEGVWRRRQEISESDRAEKIRAGRKDNEGVCTEIQKSSKKKWTQEKTISKGV